MKTVLTFPKLKSEEYNTLEAKLKIIADAQWQILNNILSNWSDNRFTINQLSTYRIDIIPNTNESNKVQQMKEDRNSIPTFWEWNQEKTQQISNTITNLLNDNQQFITNWEKLTNNPWYKSQNYVKTYLEWLNAKLISFEYTNIDELWLKSDIIIDYNKFISLFNESNTVFRVYSDNSWNYIKITLIQNVDDLIQSIKEYDHQISLFDNAEVTYYQIKSEKLDQPAPSLLLWLKSNGYVDTKIQNNDDDEGYEFIWVVEEEWEDEIPQKYFDDQRKHQDDDNYGYESEL